MSTLRLIIKQNKNLKVDRTKVLQVEVHLRIEHQDKDVSVWNNLTPTLNLGVKPRKNLLRNTLRKFYGKM